MLTKDRGFLNFVCIYLETVLKVLDAKAIVDVLEYKRKGKKVNKVVYHHLCTDKTDVQCFQGNVWPKKVFCQATSRILSGYVHAFQPFLA